jgi:hypothetical protein
MLVTIMPAIAGIIVYFILQLSLAILYGRVSVRVEWYFCYMIGYISGVLFDY